MDRGNNQREEEWGNVVVVEAQFCYASPDICYPDETSVQVHCHGADPNFLVATSLGVSIG